MPLCPSCGANRVWKDGLRYGKEGSSPIQRYLCRSCGYRFSEPTVKLNINSQIRETFNPGKNYSKAGVLSRNVTVKKALDNPSLPFREDVASHNASPLSTAEKDLNTFPFYNRKHRVSASEGGAKNLVKVEPQLEKAGAGATLADVKGKIVEYSWYMKKQGYPDSTIISRTELLEVMVKRGADLYDPEQVKGVIAKQETWGEGRKANAVYAYNTFVQMEGLTWIPPRYKREQKLPFIPLERELDAFISASGKIMGTFLQGLKETGADPGELVRIRWIDINPEKRIIALNYPVKRHNSRIIDNISSGLIARLNMLPKRERPFPHLVDGMYRNFYKQRKRIARQLGNPRLLKVVFTTFRHWKATMLYHQTKDILYVMKFLGHKCIRNTLVYIDLERAIYGTPSEEEFTVRVASTLDEACELLEAGFDYVTDMEGKKLFRKRK